jgi:Protein of unknown function (DUF3318)
VIDPNSEINRLRELMPATGRMKTRLLLDDSQPCLITAAVPRPWQATHPISLNLSRWQQLSLPQRDLLFLRTVCWVIATNLLRPDWYQGLALTGLAGTLFELGRGDALGLVAAAGLTAFSGVQIWRSSHGITAEMAADQKAVEVAQRRGYSQAEAAAALIGALEALPQAENRSLKVSELVRCQNLRSLADLAVAPLPSHRRP